MTKVREPRLPPSAALVIFGATGDLAQRKLIPALFQLFKRNHLPRAFSIICVARRPFTNAAFTKLLRDSIILRTKKQPDPKPWKAFAARIAYVQGDFDQEHAYDHLKDVLGNNPRVMYYFATAPEYFGKIAHALHTHGLARRNESKNPWPRLIFEKPFGSDLASAQKLNEQILSTFSEKQVFRIDHYLGKEAVQNIFVMRFANSIYEQIWNNRYIDNIQITAAETMGIEGRSGYYDRAGAIRDMVQNHLMHLLSYVAMEPPAGLSADEIRDEKVKVLKTLKPMTPQEIATRAVRGQYTSGTMDGKRVLGYLQEAGVKKNSRTETFAALCAHVHNWRWEGVPFFLRTGKRLARRTTEIVVTFKQAPLVLFNDPRIGGLEPNRLIIRIQPDEGIALQFNSKRPVTELAIDPVLMDFCHSCSFGPNTPEAYERLLLDALTGDSTLFTRWDEVEHAWAFIDPIQKAWARDTTPTPTYAPGSNGPKQADDLIRSMGRTWFDTRRT